METCTTWSHSVQFLEPGTGFYISLWKVGLLCFLLSVSLLQKFLFDFSCCKKNSTLNNPLDSHLA